MIKNPILFIIDNNGDYLRYKGTLRAINGYREFAFVISPRPLTDSVSMSIMTNNANYNRFEQYVLPTAIKVNEVIEESDALYQTIADWNVFGVEIKPTALADISNFRSGATTFSFQFQTPHPSTKCVTYKGVFGVDNPLPTTGQVTGDYYECEDWNFYLTSGTQTYTFTKGMYVYFNGSRWIKDALLVELNTSTVSIPVEPSHAVGYEIDDDDANYLASIGAAAILAQQTAEQSAQDVLDLQISVNENKDTIENMLLSTENDWDLETIFTEKFANGRNCWVQVDNEIYVFGGINFLGDGERPSLVMKNFSRKKSYKYNVITKQWIELAEREYNYNEERAVYKDGFIYLFGAGNPSGIVGVTSEAYSIHVCQKYEIATNTFTMLADAPLRIVETSGAVLVGDKVYVMVDSYSTFNGLETPVTITRINTVPYVYDIATNTWEVKTPTNIKFDRGFATYYNGLIYVQRSLKFQAYNPTTDTWITDLTPPTYGVVHTGLMHEYKGRIFIGSGWESSQSKNNPFIQYYDVAEDKWFVATRLEFKNHALGYGSLFLYDNKLYYIGGYSYEAEPNFNNVIRSFDLEKLQFEEIDYQRQLIQNNEDTINNMLDGTTIVKKAEQDKNGNDIVTTYETKSDATSKKAEIDGRLDTAESDIDAVEGRLDTAEGDIDTLQGDVLDLETANMIKSYTYNPTTHVITFTYYDNTTTSFDLPLESAIVSASYDDTTQDITFVLQSGATLVVPLDDLVSGLASETWVNTYFIPKTSIVDNLTTNDATKVLSAKQGKALQDTKIDKDFTTYAELTTDLSENDFVVVRDVSTNTTKKTKVSTLRGFESDTYEYGVREVVGQSSSDFERVKKVNGEITYGSATGLVANVAIDDANAVNSFDSIDIFARTKENITATDLSSNSVSNAFVKVPKYYIKEEWTTENGTDYHYYWVCSKQLPNYRLPLPFRKQDGTERDYAYMGAYEAYLDGNNKLRSLTGQIPRVSYSRNNFRTAARALDGLGVNSKYQITDLAEYVDLVQIPFMIEFATKHSQGVFLGATSMAYSASHTAIADGTAVNFIVVSNATGAAFVLGQTVSIGTSNSNDSVAKDRIVTQIDVDTPNAGETTITFDGAAVNIAIGNVIASRAWKTGMTDSVKVSGTHALNDGKHSIVWRGLENPFGNIWKNVDGVKISNWRGYVTENPKDYNDTASVAGVYAEPYLPLGYLNANTNDYAQDLGYDANYPYAKFPISVQASGGLFFRDYYYQNSGDRTVFVGGAWYDSSFAGLFFWLPLGALGDTYFFIGARLSYRP